MVLTQNVPVDILLSGEGPPQKIKPKSISGSRRDVSFRTNTFTNIYGVQNAHINCMVQQNGSCANQSSIKEGGDFDTEYTLRQEHEET